MLAGSQSQFTCRWPNKAVTQPSTLLKAPLYLTCTNPNPYVPTDNVLGSTLPLPSIWSPLQAALRTATKTKSKAQNFTAKQPCNNKTTPKVGKLLLHTLISALLVLVDAAYLAFHSRLTSAEGNHPVLPKYNQTHTS